MFGMRHFSSKHFIKKFFMEGGEGLFIFTIGGKSVLKYYKVGSYSSTKYVNNRARIGFTIIGKDGYIPKIGEEIIVEQSPCKGMPFTRIFGGFVATIKSENDSCGKIVRHKVTGVDFNSILDRRIVINVYEKQQVSEVIKSIIDNFVGGESINTDNVKTEGLVLEKAVFAYKKASACFNDITTNTGLHFYVDFYRKLHFFLRSQIQTGQSLNSDCSESTSDFCAWIKNGSCNDGIKAGKISVDRSSDQLKNNMYIIAGWDTTAERVELSKGNGTDQTFVLKFPVGDVISIELNSVVQTFDDRDNGDPSAQWFWTKGENGIYQNDDNAPLSNIDILTVRYKGLFKVVVNELDERAITQRGAIEHTSGIYQDVEADDSIESEAYAVQRAKGFLRRFKNVPIRVFYSSDVQLLDVGQIISVNLPDHGIENFDNGFLVNSIKVRDVNGRIFRYDYELISTENLENWQEFFRKIEFFGRKLKLDEQKKIVSTVISREPRVVEQEFFWSEGDMTEPQNNNYERQWCCKRTFCNYARCATPEVVRLGLV